jgi:hypothetical protein
VNEAGHAPRLRVLYLMHVDWGWIRQRPHHLAEGLAAQHELEVVYPRSWRRSALVRNESAVTRRGLLQVPLRRHLPLAAAVDTTLKRLAVRAELAAFQPDVVWLTHPRLEPLLPDELPPGAILVYDCMDDALAFPDTPVERRGLAEAEARLAWRSALVFASSARLAELLVARGFPQARLELLGNAGDAEIAPRAPAARAPGAPLRAAYFGTISSWLDFAAILHALDAIPELEVSLVGPREAPVPSHPRLAVRGPVPHERLAGLAAEADVLLVPFQRTELVESVDPVKLYEYVAFGREIVSLRWAESEKFARFAHLYDTPAELVAALDLVRRGGGRPGEHDLAERTEFLRRNSWGARAAQAGAALCRARGAWRQAS